MKMTDKRNLFVTALFAVLITIVIACTGRGHFYEFELFRSGSGWGYNIQINNKPYIHQPYMPAVEGNVPFSDKQSARRSARLVLKKIKNHQNPGITQEELNSITDGKKQFR